MDGGVSRDILSPSLPKRRLSNDADDSYDGETNKSFKYASVTVSTPAVPQRDLSEGSMHSYNSSDPSSDDDEDDFFTPKGRCHSYDDYVIRKSHSIAPASRFDQVFEKQSVKRHSSMPMSRISRISMTGEVVHASSLSSWSTYYCCCLLLLLTTPAMSA